MESSGPNIRYQVLCEGEKLTKGKRIQPYACDQAKKCYDQLNLTEVKFFNIY